MAHTCPNCGAFCTCQGDWDDIDFGEWLGCRHDCEEDDLSDVYVPDEDEEGEDASI